MPTLILLIVVCLGAPEFGPRPVPDEARVRALIRDLGSDSWTVREAARQALAALGDAARPDLEKALADPDLEIRRAAAELLREGRSAGIPDLERLLRRRDSDLAASPAYASILARGAEVMPLLIEAIRRENSTYPRYDYTTLRNAYRLIEALAATGKIGPDRIPELLDLLDTDNTNCRSLSRPVLRRLAGAALLPLLEKGFREDPAPRRRARLLELLFDEDRKKGLGLIPDAIVDEEPEVRLAAAQLIRFQSGEEHLPLMIQATTDPDPEVRAAVVQGLQRHPHDRAARTAVRVALADPDDAVRRNALIAAAQMHRQRPDPTLIPEVRTFLRESDPAVVQAAAQLLGSARDRDAVPLLLALLERDDETFRPQIITSVIMALGQIEDPSARKPLETFVRDPATRGDSRFRTARVYAVQALLRIAGEDALGLLRETLADLTDTYAPQILLQTLLEVPGSDRVAIFRAYLDHEDRTVVARAAQGLGQAGAADAAPRLVALLSREDAYLRQSVLEALGALGSEEAAPGLLAFLKTLIGDDGSIHSRNAYHVRLAIEALAAAHHRPAEDLLVRLVKARGRFTNPAAVALGHLGGDAAKAAIAEVLEERSRDAMGRDLAIALSRLGNPTPLREIHRQEMLALESGLAEGPALASAADSAIRLGQPERALDIARRRVRESPVDPLARYDLACILALAGESEAALKTLEEAMARGYRNPRRLLRDPDLRGLHGRPGFRVLLARMNRR